MEILLNSFQEHSIIWILISAGGGGLIGATINFLFSEILAPRLRRQRESKAALRRFKHPLLRAADTLDRRLQNFISFVEKDWYDDEDRDYYRLSTLYLFGRYFGWCVLLERAAFLEYETSDNNAKEFSKYFYRVYKALTGYYYFNNVDNDSLDVTPLHSIPRLTLTAMGELMIEPDASDEAGSIIGFTEFVSRYESQDEFRRWFSYLDEMLADLERDPTDVWWNRLVIVASSLRAFVAYLDPESRQTAPRKIYYLDSLHRQVVDVVEEELIDSGAGELLQDPDE